jgi:hypothetical protein
VTRENPGVACMTAKGALAPVDGDEADVDQP